MQQRIIFASLSLGAFLLVPCTNAQAAEPEAAAVPAPAAGAPSAVAPATALPAPAATMEGFSVRLEAQQPHLTYYLQRSTGTMAIGGRAGSFETFERLCEAPCSVKLPRGSYRIAVGLDAEEPVDTGEPLRVDGDTTVRAVRESRKDVRLGLFWGGIATSAVGLGLMGGGAANATGDSGIPLMTAGTVATIGGLVVMLSSGWVQDHREMSTTPTPAPGAAAFPRAPEPPAPKVVPAAHSETRVFGWGVAF